MRREERQDRSPRRSPARSCRGRAADACRRCAPRARPLARRACAMAERTSDASRTGVSGTHQTPCRVLRRQPLRQPGLQVASCLCHRDPVSVSEPTSRAISRASRPASSCIATEERRRRDRQIRLVEALSAAGSRRRRVDRAARAQTDPSAGARRGRADPPVSTSAAVGGRDEHLAAVRGSPRSAPLGARRSRHSRRHGSLGGRPVWMPIRTLIGPEASPSRASAAARSAPSAPSERRRRTRRPGCRPRHRRWAPKASRTTRR